MIEVKNLKKQFGELSVLNGITEHISQGEKIAVIGPSGSGKSTFLRCLNLLEIPTEGEIWFDGVNMTDVNVDIDRMRQKMGMVFQHFNLFPHLTVLENIILAPVHLKLQTRKKRRRMQDAFWSESVFLTRQIPIRLCCQAVRSRGLPLSGRLL